MAKEAAIEMEGIVIESLPNAEFIVEILPPEASQAGDDEDSDEEQKPVAPLAALAQSAEAKHRVRAHISGKMRMHYIKINPGDRVTVEVSPYDPGRGRITYRNK